MSVRVKSVGDWWEADPESKLFRLAERALAREWNVQPLFVREGGTMPVSRILLSLNTKLSHPDLLQQISGQVFVANQ